MARYEYKLEPRTYKTVLRVIDEFWQECTDRKQNPTLIRLIQYPEKGVNQYNPTKAKKGTK